MLRKGRRLLPAPAGSCHGAAGPSRQARDGAARSRPVPTAARRGEPGQGAAGTAVRLPRSRCSYLSLPESALVARAGQAPFALPPALPQPRLCPSPGSPPALPQPQSPLPPYWPLSAAEDASGELGDAVSTISSSMNPLQPPGASSEEPFTTYFDSKIPIPDDETVRAAGPLRSLRQLNPIGMSERSGATRVVPRAPVLLCAQTGEGGGAAGWGSGGEGSSVELMIRGAGFVAGRAENGLVCGPRGGDLGPLSPYRGLGAGMTARSPCRGVGALFAFD